MDGRGVSTWPVLLLAAPAGVAIWSGWVGLGRMTGFGVVDLLPGIWDRARIDSAITLPVGMETYAAYALHVWLSPAVTGRARSFARWSSIGSLLLGAAGQVAYHLMSAAGYTAAPWQITALVACLPVAVLGMGASLAQLVRSGAAVTPHTTPSSTPRRATPPSTPHATPPSTPHATPPSTPRQTTPPSTPPSTPRQTTPPSTPPNTPRQDTADRVRRAKRDNPEASQQEIADALGVSLRTVSRYLTADREAA